MYQSGTPAASIASFICGVSPLPLRTDSIVLNDRDLSIFMPIRYDIISSLVQIAVESVAFPLWISDCAFPSHTSVPWDSPDMRTSSDIEVGLVSSSIPITNFVPNSGIPKDPTSIPPFCSGVMPSAFVELKRLMTVGSSSGISTGLRPVRSCSILIMVGSSCPRISSFNRLWSME